MMANTLDILHHRFRTLRAVWRLSRVTRFEVIDSTGRRYANSDCRIEFSFQDRERTLKVFVDQRPVR